MAETFATIILGGSLLGIGTILFRKAPLLVELEDDVDIKAPILKFKDRVKEVNPFSLEKILHKILSTFRVFSLRLEKKTGDQLQKLREKSKIKRNGGDNYWEELKKAKEENEGEML